MRKLLIWIFVLILVSSVYALEVCEYEEDPNTACNVISPAGMNCDTYIGLWENGSQAFSGTASELYASSGIYNFTLNESASGGLTIYWCDNTTGYINIKTTDETDLTTILANQVILEQEILDTQQNITDINNTLTLNVIGSYLADATFGLNALKTIFDTLATTIQLNSQIQNLAEGMDNNRTALQTYGNNSWVLGDSYKEMINQTNTTTYWIERLGR